MFVQSVSFCPQTFRTTIVQEYVQGWSIETNIIILYSRAVQTALHACINALPDLHLRCSHLPRDGVQLYLVYFSFFVRKSTLFYGTFLALTGVGLQVGAKYSDVFELMIVGRLICGINAGSDSKEFIIATC